MSLASLAEYVGTIYFYFFLLLRASIMYINYYAELLSEAAKLTGLSAPNTSCLRLCFLEAETETGIWMHVTYRGRGVRREAEK